MLTMFFLLIQLFLILAVLLQHQRLNLGRLVPLASLLPEPLSNVVFFLLQLDHLPSHLVQLHRHLSEHVLVKFRHRLQLLHEFLAA